MKLSLLAFIPLFVASLTGCPQAVASVVPDVALVECVIIDALKSAPVSQIVTDCGADAVTVVTTLLATKSPDVASTPAHREALARDSGK